MAIGTDANKEVHISMKHYDPSTDEWVDGFGLQSNNIRIRARFKQNIPFSTWKEENFYLRSNVIEPGEAVVDGYNSLFFCSPGDVQIVTLGEFPDASNNPEYCYWHYRWVWELPSGWKITSAGGNLGTATNIYQGHGNTVKIQAPSTGLSSATLNVRSEDVFPYPVNTQTEVIVGAPPAPTNILYENGQQFPTETCVGGLFGRMIDVTAVSVASIKNLDYVEWESDAGALGASTTPDAYNTLNLMFPGTNRYVRVRTVNDCGLTSPWVYKYFNLVGDPSCAEGGMSGFSIQVYPSPTSGEDLTVELKEQNETAKSKTRQMVKVEYYLYDEDLNLVAHEKALSKKEKLSTKELPNGKYFLKIVTPYGTENRQVLINN